MIKAEAHKLGFAFCGIARAAFLEEEAPLLERWLKQGMNGEMAYMENHFEARLDPRKLVPGAKSMIVLMLNYFPEKTQTDATYKVSKYAYGRDYHKVMKQKMKALMAFIHENIGAAEGRAFTDSAPVMDKAWAKRSGLGWQGKNANIISKQAGSFHFIGELILDLELEYDSPTTDHCGKCTRCIDACPTQAIVAPYVVDGSRCISYLTIELKNSLPANAPSWNEWVFGCDVCQDVCPWNRFSKPTQEKDFAPRRFIDQWTAAEWEELTEEVFPDIFAGSPINRAGYGGIARSLLQLKKAPAQSNTGDID